MESSKPNLSHYTKFNSNYDDAIVWDTYGYTIPHTSIPSWCSDDFIKEAKNFAANLKQPNFQLWFQTYSNRENFTCGADWITYDSNNKLIIWENSVGGCSTELSAKQYVLNEHNNHVRLFSDVFDALLIYQKTGIACLPNWNKNTSDNFGYKNNTQNPIPRAKDIKIN